jgi:hypothetical protein
MSIPIIGQSKEKAKVVALEWITATEANFKHALDLSLEGEVITPEKVAEVSNVLLDALGFLTVVLACNTAGNAGEPLEENVVTLIRKKFADLRGAEMRRATAALTDLRRSDITEKN